MKVSDEHLAGGLHPYESATGVRWTNGDALVPAVWLRGWTGPIELVLHLRGATSYIDDGRLRSAA